MGNIFPPLLQESNKITIYKLSFGTKPFSYLFLLLKFMSYLELHIQRGSQSLEPTQQTFVLMKTFWRRLEDVFRLRLQKTSSRRGQDVLIKTNMFALALRLQKTSSRRLGQDQYIRLGHTSSRRLQDVFKTSSRRLQDVFKTSCQDVFNTFSRRLQDVFKKSSRRFESVFKTSSRRFQDVLSG